jgi:alkaline phosphatase
VASVVFSFLVGPDVAPAKGVKNVIVMVADGAGFNAYQAAAMYEGKWDPQRGSTQVYNGPDWVQYACTTYPLNTASKPTRDPKQDAKAVYEPSLAWDTSPLKDKPLFVGYKYLATSPTDSAASATALATGVKTFNKAINWSNDDQPLSGATLPEIAKAQGKAVGVVTSVPWSHATPACLGGAHNRVRDDYPGIANEMLAAPYLDAIFGAGNPDYDNNGQLVPEDQKADEEPKAETTTATTDKTKTTTQKAVEKKPVYTPRYVGGRATWKLLKEGKHPAGWRLIETRSQFEALAQDKGYVGPKVVGTAQVYSTLQQARGKFRATDKPYSQPMNAGVPDLPTMAQAAIRVLESDPDGFYLMIEGGAVDWANHANQPARLIEEQVDFNRTVRAVVQWIEAHSNWEETLLIVTADHETGLIWGKNSDKVPYEPLGYAGPGKLPAMRYHLADHTKSLVPLYARGPGSEGFAACVRGRDPGAAAKWRISGEYVDNTDIFAVVHAGLAGEAVPAAK